jgi:catechol 2,3-dioxygenase-like lactoylglutathione lyase family enzyme
MFDHVKFGVSDLAASKAFFLKALEPLGVAVVSEGPPAYGVELSPKGQASLCLYQTEEKPACNPSPWRARNYCCSMASGFTAVGGWRLAVGSCLGPRAAGATFHCFGCEAIMRSSGRLSARMEPVVVWHDGTAP